MQNGVLFAFAFEMQVVCSNSGVFSAVENNYKYNLYSD